MADALTTRCCIAGGGPAGMMLGLLLARAGVDVLVLEKHADFLRDFRGDTVHPSTLRVMEELGLIDAFLQRPHDKVRELVVQVNGEEATVADMSRLRWPYVVMMPQWDFLDFLCEQAMRYPNFRLLRNAEATGVRMQGGRVAGVDVALRGDAAGQTLQVDADLVIGADGRHSVLRGAAGLAVHDIGAPIDVLWMRLPRQSGDPHSTGGHINRGHFLVMIDRGTYWQCAYVIAKGGMDAVKARGLQAFHAELAGIVPALAGRLPTALASWDDIRLLTVTVDRLERWWVPGLLCIGDAAHAMSPVGGVGINLAIQDAVATANLLAAPLADAAVAPEALTPLLAKVQQRRLLPARLTQSAQVAVQNGLLAPVVGAGGTAAQSLSMPWPMKLLKRWPLLRAIPAYAVGIGVRPEHVQSGSRP